MPRGFLVKRNKKFSAMSYRPRSPERMDELPTSGLGVPFPRVMPCESPDSGYGSRPMTPADPRPTHKATPGKNTIFPSSFTPVISSIPLNVPTPHGFAPQSPIMERFLARDELFPSYTKTPTTPLTKSTPARCSSVRKRPYSDVDSPNKSRRSVKKHKAVRKIDFDADTSPVLGTYIRPDTEVLGNNGNGEKNNNIVSDSARPKGLFVCKLCREDYHDPISLAQHKCSRIAHIEYRCSECDKVFNSHANLASHRRWHKQRPVSDTPSPTLFLPEAAGESETGDSVSSSSNSSPRSTPSPVDITGRSDPCYRCEQCGKTYRRPGNLRRHLRQHGEADTHPCYKCGQAFSSLTGLTKHMLSYNCQDRNENGESLSDFKS